MQINLLAENIKRTKIKLWTVIFSMVLILIFSMFLIFTTENSNSEQLDEIEYTQPPETVDPDFVFAPEVMEFETDEYIVIKILPRKKKVFTQGLFMDTTNTLIESGGLYGQSTLHKYNVDSVDDNLFTIKHNQTIFAEGACIFENYIYQLTWKEGVMFAYPYNKDQIQEYERVEIPNPKEIKEGWGVTTNDEELIISDGSNKIYFVSVDLDNKIASVRRFIEVKNITSGVQYSMLNELEYANGFIYSNVWLQNVILIIDPTNGNVVR